MRQMAAGACFRMPACGTLISMSGMHTIDPQPANLKQFLLTTFALKCPACAEGKLFASGFNLKETCDVCHARFERGKGEWTGPVVVGYAVGSGIAFVLWLYLFATDRLFPGSEIAACVLAIALSLATYRNAKGFWIWLLHMAGLVFPDRLLQ